MKTSRKLQAIAFVIGLGLFTAAGLFVTIGAQKPQTDKLPAPGPVPESVTATAEQLGKAFAAIAAHVKPAVVSVYSEKTVQFQSPEFQFPFGDDFFNQFFGEQFVARHPESQRVDPPMVRGVDAAGRVGTPHREYGRGYQLDLEVVRHSLVLGA